MSCDKCEECGGKKSYTATSITTGGSKVFWMTRSEYLNAHRTHPAWCKWRETLNHPPQEKERE